jgi:hypothetical protein
VGHNSGTWFTGHRHRCAPSGRWAELDGKGSCSKRSQLAREKNLESRVRGDFNFQRVLSTG